MLQSRSSDEGANRPGEISRESLVAVDVDSYDEKKLAGKCTRRGCTSAACDESSMCRRHHDAHKLADARYRKKRRAKARAGGYCGRCCVEKAARDSTLCVPCMDEVGGIKARTKGPQGLVAKNVDNHRQRVAARMIEWQNSPQNEGRVRMRGGKRGRRGIGDENTADLLDMARYVERAMSQNEFTESGEAKAMPPIQRANARAEGAAWVLLLVRTGLEYCKRNGYELPAQADHNIGDSFDDDED